MSSGLTVKSAALNYMEQVGNNTAGKKSLAIVIEVNTPRVTGSFAKYFKLFFGWMIAPDSGIDSFSLRVWSSRLTYI